MIFLDTHIVAWLYEGELQQIPPQVQRRLDQEPLAISPFVQLELGYLYEVGKVTETAEKVIEDLGPRLELAVVDSSLTTVCRAAQELTWTRDPFDRLISAHATVANVPLVTRDRTIRANLSLAWWAA